jgi:hypothetical protein
VWSMGADACQYLWDCCPPPPQGSMAAAEPHTPCPPLHLLCCLQGRGTWCDWSRPWS